MQIILKLDKDFERTVAALTEKYGEDFLVLNGVAESQLDYSEFINNFVDKKTKTTADATIDGSANARAKDIVSFKSEKDKSEDKVFALNKIFYEMKKKYGLKTAKDWLEAEWSGAFYLHDAHTATYLPYCYAYDLTRLATEGLFFLDNYNPQSPKHLSSFIDMLIEFISFFSNRSAGAVGIPNVLIWTYYFWKHDVANGYYIKSPDYDLRQNFQKLVYRLNQPFLRITQSSFTNMSIFDRYYVESLFGGVVYPDGSMVIDDIDGFLVHEKIFMEVVSEVRAENMFTYPVLTYSLLKRDDVTEEEWKEMVRTHDYKLFKDNDFARWCSDHNTKWNDSNFFGSENVNTLSNCCRLLSDTSKLDAFVNSIGGTALSIGSIKVNTINLMRIALESKEEKDYLKLLKARTVLCCKTLDIQRHIITRNIEKGLLPNYVDGGIDIKKQYSTIGILGLYEVVKFYGHTKVDEFGCISYTAEGLKLAEDILATLNAAKDEFPANYSFNIESVPAERAAVVLCAKDNILFDRHEDSNYSNQWIPLTAKCTIAEKIKLSADLDPKCGGGAIAHINLENNFPNTDIAWEMLNKIMYAGVIYFAFNTKINVCKHNHGFVGTNICPVCGEPTVDTWQRIVGFLTPSQSYSKERFKEFSARQWYKYAQDQNSLIE